MAESTRKIRSFDEAMNAKLRMVFNRSDYDKEPCLRRDVVQYLFVERLKACNYPTEKYDNM